MRYKRFTRWSDQNHSQATGATTTSAVFKTSTTLPSASVDLNLKLPSQRYATLRYNGRLSEWQSGLTSLVSACPLPGHFHTRAVVYCTQHRRATIADCDRPIRRTHETGEEGGRGREEKKRREEGRGGGEEGMPARGYSLHVVRLGHRERERGH